MSMWDGLTPGERDHKVAEWIAARGRVERFLAESPEIPGDMVREMVAREGEVLIPGDPQFPASAANQIPTLGPWFVRGTLPRGATLAVVGTRAVDFEGERICKRIVSEVAAAGFAIVSGGALGVDTLAHRAALSAGASTVAFLPSAFDRLTPARNNGLFERIVHEGGALVTEYPLGTAAHRFHFHRRNQLIAAYADAVLVIRAKAVGGTMITARAALEMGRKLLVIPGSPEDETSAGCNQLIRAGARCVTNAAEVLQELPAQGELPAFSPRMSPQSKRVLDALSSGALDTDSLTRVTTLLPREVAVALTQLELSGFVTRSPHGWAKTR